MVLSGFAAINSGSPERDLIHDMDLSIETAVSYLNDISRGVDGDDQLRGVATTAAVGDVMSGQLAFDSLQNAGDDGVVYLEDSTNQETNTLVRKGMFFDRGYISNQFVTDEPQQLATLENAYILLASVRISGMRDILGVIEHVVDDSRESSRKSLLVIADDISDDALETLIINVKRGAFSSVAVKAPGLNMQRDFLEDIAIATGGIVVVHASLLGGITLSQLGFAKQVEVSKDSTWLIEPRADKSLVTSRAAGIRQQILLTRDDHERERLRERLAKLTGSTCVIRVGGASSLDREERNIESTPPFTRCAARE